VDYVEIPTVITAISDPEFEGLVSSALFSQGWNVVARALDMSELKAAVQQSAGKKLLIIFSPDLTGVSNAEIGALARDGISIFGFTDQSGGDRGFTNLFPRPKSPDDLILLILESVRFSGARSPLIHSNRRCNAKVVAIGGVGHSTGATTIAINLAQEIALLGRKTLLVEANFLAPAISFYLDLRKVAAESRWREVSENLSVMELTQANIEGFEDRILSASEDFDLIIFDLGSVAFLTHELSDRRWGSSVKIWTMRCADIFIFTGGPSVISQKRFADFCQKLSNLSLSARTFLAITESAQKQSGAKALAKDKELSGAITWNFPWDARSCLTATTERSTLAQVVDRSALRKALVKFAQVLVQ
jgi:hypothetical protein